MNKILIFLCFVLSFFSACDREIDSTDWMEATESFILSSCPSNQILTDTLDRKFSYQGEAVFSTLYDYILYRTNFRNELLTRVDQIAEITGSYQCRITEYYNEQSSKAIIYIANEEIEDIQRFKKISTEEILLDFVSSYSSVENDNHKCIVAGDHSSLTKITIITDVSKDRRFTPRFFSFY